MLLHYCVTMDSTLHLTNKTSLYLRLHLGSHSSLTDRYSSLITASTPNGIWNFGILCCLTTPGLRKDIWRQIRQLYSRQVLYYVYYYYIYIIITFAITFSHLFLLLIFILSYTGLFLWGRKEHGHNCPLLELLLMCLLSSASV